MSAGHLDEAASIFLARELQYVRRKVLEVPKAPLEAFTVFPVQTEVPAGAETAYQRVYDAVGVAKLISNIPSRPFLRIAFDDNRKAWEGLAEDLLDQIVDRCMSASQVGKTMGKRMQKDIREVIGDKSRLAPNAPSTIRRKGHDKPLIDTGTMQKRVNYRVEGGGA